VSTQESEGSKERRLRDHYRDPHAAFQCSIFHGAHEKFLTTLKGCITKHKRLDEWITTEELDAIIIEADNVFNDTRNDHIWKHSENLYATNFARRCENRHGCAESVETVFKMLVVEIKLHHIFEVCCREIRNEEDPSSPLYTRRTSRIPSAMLFAYLSRDAQLCSTLCTQSGTDVVSFLTTCKKLSYEFSCRDFCERFNSSHEYLKQRSPARVASSNLEGNSVGETNLSFRPHWWQLSFDKVYLNVSTRRELCGEMHQSEDVEMHTKSAVGEESICVAPGGICNIQ
jgi:hypothetical protein